MSIIIFSRPVHSGKTTELMNYYQQQPSLNISGVLMPDVDGTRKIFDLANKSYFDIECTDAENANERLVMVGKYCFYQSAFDKANHIISKTIESTDLLIIDEVGKLELVGKGLYPATQHAVNDSSFQSDAKHLLLVVRDSLYDAVISNFNIGEHRLIHEVNSI